jgi:glutamyl-tRNA synthetase
MSTDVVTRFAPSPTGYLHIGGARTALFNWLYARHHGGKMLLRIEDTDRERSTEAAIVAIIDGLDWLGIHWDDKPIFQSARADRHKEIAETLLAAGKAYRCYATPDELNEMRALARAEGRPPIYDGRWRDRDPAEAPPGVDPVIRIKSPETGETVLNDAVQGDVTFPNKDLDDFILLRSDGTPTYMLSVVVDDHDMGVTQIIRGDDHLTNAARQQFIYDAMDWPAPALAHIPLIHGPDGAKLSKRHGALGVDAYRAMGYLPAALRNYLVRLGWAHGDDEIMTVEQMIEWFDLSGIGRSAARFDFAKLENLNGHYIRAADDDALLSALIKALPHLPGGPEFAAALTADRREQLRRALPGLKTRAKTLVELMEGAMFLVKARPLDIDDKARALLTDDARARLAEIAEKLGAVEPWTEEATEAVVKAMAEEKGLKLGALAQPLRAALTGRSSSPGIFEVLAILGKDESLGRIADQVRQAV